MAMLLLRSGGLCGTQKIPLSALTYTKEGSSSSNNMIQEDDSSQHPHQQRSSRSSRKSKNGHKKIPQRGLGVAQLEKLRLEELQKQEAACLASLHRAHILPPLHSQASLHPQGVFPHNCSPQIKGRPPEQHAFISSNSCKMSDSIISMANLHSMNFKMGLNNNSPQQQSPRAENRNLSKNNTSSVGRMSEPVESCVTNVGVTTSGMWPAHNRNGEDLNHFMNQEMDARKASMLVLRSQNPPCSLPSDLRFFEPLLRSPAGSRKLQMVNISSSGATIQLEPPSNQSYSTNPPWTEEDRIAGIKRPWPFSQENTGYPIRSKAPCLNGIHETSNGIPNLDRLEAAKQEPAGLFRNSLEISLGLFKKKTPWQANSDLASPGSKHRSEPSFSCDSGSTPNVCCVGQPITKDSCSSSTSLKHGFTLNWKTSSENDNSSQEIETPDGAFLTLGLPCSTDVDVHVNEHHCKRRQHFATLDACDEYPLSKELLNHQQEGVNGGVSTTRVLPSNGLHMHGSSKSIEERCLPFYKFLSTPNDKGTADFFCQDSKVSQGEANQSVDLNLKLSL